MKGDMQKWRCPQSGEKVVAGTLERQKVIARLSSLHTEGFWYWTIVCVWKFLPLSFYIIQRSLIKTIAYNSLIFCWINLVKFIELVYYDPEMHYNDWITMIQNVYLFYSKCIILWLLGFSVNHISEVFINCLYLIVRYTCTQ